MYIAMQIIKNYPLTTLWLVAAMILSIASYLSNTLASGLFTFGIFLAAMVAVVALRKHG